MIYSLITLVSSRCVSARESGFSRSHLWGVWVVTLGRSVLSQQVIDRSSVDSAPRYLSLASIPFRLAGVELVRIVALEQPKADLMLGHFFVHQEGCLESVNMSGGGC